MVSILVSMPPSEETPFRHSVQERMARERRRIKHSSTYTMYTEHAYGCHRHVHVHVHILVLLNKDKHTQHIRTSTQYICIQCSRRTWIMQQGMTAGNIKLP